MDVDTLDNIIENLEWALDHLDSAIRYLKQCECKEYEINIKELEMEKAVIECDVDKYQQERDEQEEIEQQEWKQECRERDREFINSRL